MADGIDMLRIRKANTKTLHDWFVEHRHGEALDWAFYNKGDYYELVDDKSNCHKWWTDSAGLEVLGMFRYNYNDGKECGISSVLIGKPYMHKGYGSKLLDLLREKHDKIWLYCNSHNLEFYLTNGFVEYKCDSPCYHYLVWEKATKHNSKMKELIRDKRYLLPE